MGDRPANSRSILPWIGVVAGVLATIVGAVVLVRSAPIMPHSSDSGASLLKATERPPALGVHAVIRAGQIVVERELPTMAFSLEPGQSLGPAIPPGAFEAEFTVTFNAGDVRQARIGAELWGGDVIITRGKDVLVSDHAGDDVRAPMSQPTYWAPRVYSVTYRFRTSGAGPMRLRALWQPMSSIQPFSLPGDGSEFFGDQRMRGLALVQRYNCAACHVSSDAAVQASLHVNPAPILTEVGARVRPAWIGAWLADPQAIKPGVAMPRLFRGSAEDASRIDDLTHFLVSLGGPAADDESSGDQSLIETGAAIYGRVGCVACHGPIDVATGQMSARDAGLSRDYTPLGPLKGKTLPGALAKFLRDPVAVRPSGRMPAQNLDEAEARAVAAFLIEKSRGLDEAAGQVEKLQPDPERAERGKALFMKLGCASCHSLGSDFKPPLSDAPSMERIGELCATGEGVSRGCLSSSPSGRAPFFSLGDETRRLMATYLATLKTRRSGDVPLDRLGSTMLRLNCIGCHSVHGSGGPEPMIARQFTSLVEVDLGDEGRWPPDLSFVGAKLRPEWIRHVLEEAGRARPYLATRMPQFGPTNIGAMPALLTSAAGASSAPDGGPPFDAEQAAVGRALVGSKGFNCIQCHDIAGHPATGTPGPDLVGMVERLRYDRFVSWVSDPKLIRPGTRMPTFFNDGFSGLTEHYGGEAKRQIAAVWSYLSQGQSLPLPEGIVEPESLELKVGAEPLIFRTFMKDAGVRAIACGFPEQIHCAFDAERCTVALVWSGSFLNAAGAWAQRGGSQTNPAEVRWTAPMGPVWSLAASEHAQAMPATPHFRGYRLDDQHRPVFLYDLVAGGVQVSVTDQPTPVVQGAGRALLRVLSFEGSQGAEVLMKQPGGDGGVERVPLDDSGRAERRIEVRW